MPYNGSGFGMLNPSGYLSGGGGVAPKPPGEVATWQGWWPFANMPQTPQEIGTNDWPNDTGVAPVGMNQAQTSVPRMGHSVAAVDGSPSNADFYAHVTHADGCMSVMSGTPLANLRATVSGSTFSLFWLEEYNTSGNMSTVFCASSAFAGRFFAIGVADDGGVEIRGVGLTGSLVNDSTQYWRNTTPGIIPIESWVSLLVTQPADGSGLLAFVNGVAVPMTFDDNGVAGASQDHWFAAIKNSASGVCFGQRMRASATTILEAGTETLGHFLDVGFTINGSLITDPADAAGLDAWARQEAGI